MEEVVDVPYCRICRRSSELKWRKHVFSKSHQRAAAELLATRVADVAQIRTQIAAGVSDHEMLRAATYCVFCEIKIETRNQWIAHFGSSGHRKMLHEFCKHHRCDANQELRPELFLTAEDAALIKALTNTAKESSSKVTSEGPSNTIQNETSTPLPPKRSTGVHVQAFLESATTRLHQVRSKAEASCGIESQTEGMGESKASWMGPHTNPFVRIRTVTSSAGIQQNPHGRHEGKRVWGGGIVKVKKSEWIQWGIDLLVAAEEERGLGDVVSTTGDENNGSGVFQHRWTEAAHGVGLQSIRHVDWGENVANIHSAAVPPWMVDTEEEYKRCNRRTSRAKSAIYLPPQHIDSASRANTFDPAISGNADDIFACLQPKYDEKTWLPNFGGVWQDGPRHKTQKEFRKTQGSQRNRANRGAPSQPEFKPLRSAQPSPPAGDMEPVENADSARIELNEEIQHPPKASSVFSPTALAVEHLPSDLDAKKMLLLAQKERLRAKLAAKRRAPS